MGECILLATSLLIGWFHKARNTHKGRVYRPETQGRYLTSPCPIGLQEFKRHCLWWQADSEWYDGPKLSSERQIVPVDSAGGFGGRSEVSLWVLLCRKDVYPGPLKKYWGDFTMTETPVTDVFTGLNQGRYLGELVPMAEEKKVIRRTKNISRAPNHARGYRPIIVSSHKKEYRPKIHFD